MYVLHDDSGSITSTIKGPDKDYGSVLDAEGFKWVFLEGVETLDPHAHFIKDKALVKREDLQVSVSKLRIKGDGLDISIVSGIPEGSSLTVTCGQEVLFSGIVTDESVEISSATPSVLVVQIMSPEHLPYVCAVEAV